MKKLLISAVALSAVLGAKADSLTYSDFFGPSLTDFTSQVTLPKFDAALGDLCGITYTLKSTVEGTANFDSENPQPSVITVKIGGKISLKDGATTLILLTPSVSSGGIPVTGDTDGFPPDFLGTDSGSYGAAAAASGAVVVAPANFASFIGGPGDTFTWDVEANGDSQATGSANLFLFFTQEAKGEVSIRYDYNCVVPETSTYLSALGLVGVAALAGRRLVRR